MTDLSPKERMRIPRQPMPAQAPEERKGNFDEVALGFTDELALQEARRCIQCKKPLCVAGCPVGVDIPQFIRAVCDGDMKAAARIMKTKNNLPAVCGRVCPQETQCEILCVLKKKGEPVAIGRLERFVGDFELANRTCPVTKDPATGKKAAIIGSGPAGVTCAVDLARKGHKVDIYEALQKAGGVLIYGIPEFRLPKQLVNDEIDYAAGCLGIRILLDNVVGRTYTLEELLKEYDAVFLGTGAGLPSFMRIPGINYNGVMSANEFLTRVNLMKGYLFPEYDTPAKVGRKVAVIGAGNVAMDAARCSLRLQVLEAARNGGKPGEVHIVYRRSPDEVPARAEEVHNAKEEGIIFDFLTNPVEILGDETGLVKGMRCIRMELGAPDASGRKSPVPIKGSEFLMEVDTVIMALGTSPNPLVFSDAPDLKRTKWGTAEANPEIGRTSKFRVWAGGDVVTGAATVIEAMGAGKAAAADIHKFLLSDLSEKDARASWTAPSL